MGSKGGGGGGGAGNGISTIPSGSRKMVQSLKEIVNCPDLEIYTALKECNMDPNEAVNRLLSQDPFHEVKSKREKKKESKDTTELRPRGAITTSTRGGRSGAERYAGRGRANLPSSSEPGKPPYKKENGSHAYTGSSSSAYIMSGNSVNRQITHSDALAWELKVSAVGESDLISSSVQPSPGLQRAWGGVPGQVSMADIVKMGRPQGKVSGTSNAPIHQGVLPPSSAISHDDFQQLDQSSKVYMSDPNDDWPLDEQQAPPASEEWPPFENTRTAVSSALDSQVVESKLYGGPSDLPLDGTSQHLTSQLDNVHLLEDGSLENNANHMGLASVSNRNIQDDDDVETSYLDNNVYKNINAFQPHVHSYEHNEAEDVTTVATNLQEQLNLQNSDEESLSEEDGPAVVIPVQVHTPDCQHLSFGSFGSGAGAGARTLQSNLAETQPVTDASSVALSDTRNTEHYGEEHLRPPSDGDDIHATVVSAGSYEAPSASQPDSLKQQSVETTSGNQYTFPSSAPGFSYDNAQQLNAAFNHQQTSSQLQNLASFSSVLPSYSSSLPSALLASTVQTGRESDLPYLPFPVTQSMPTKFSNPTSSMSSSVLSTPEAFRAANISGAQQTPQNLTNAGLSTGPALPQHLAMHPYSQPTLPLGHFANMVSYPFLPQSYSYVPSAFQQTFTGNSTYHQSLAALLPQYKNSLSSSSLPQSGAIPSGYGFNGSTGIPGGNFSLNPPAAPATTTLGYDDALSSQYKDANSLLSLQQNENSAMWLQGPGARTMPTVAANTYYNFQGQTQQPTGLRQGQGQQPSQHFGSLNYPNFYQSAGISLEHQQQIARDSSLSGSQSQQAKQSAQIWQNTY
ncbi:hypothetical protein BT93_L0502 [Corymbia citriodora subsp. variegata]|uniref:GBF-interacting protein 1 N-terminal domain-containing protein n=1 Tax=Corymbia citriodora subsp. variegata TaxID=360336 RepID=A0A8T0D0H5_CORYI|nr:hypothetical protein BT93_L0502 [Corymbia citriodora subsp. variegata]